MGKQHDRKKNRADKVEDKPVEVSLYSYSSLQEEVQQLIIVYRSQQPDHGFKHIEDTLKDDHFLVVKRKQIRQVLKAHALIDQPNSSFDRRKGNVAKNSRSFETAYADELCQINVSYMHLTGRAFSKIFSIIF